MRNESRKIENKIPEWQVRVFAYSVFIADKIRSFLKKKNITTNELADKVGFSREKAKRMLSGSYDFSVEEMTKLDLLFSGHYDLYEKKLLTEKIID